MNNRRPHSDRPQGSSDRGGQSGSGGGRNRRRRRPSQDGQRQRPEPAVEQVRRAPPVLKRYGVVFYDNHSQAREDSPRLLELQKQFDQLNIVIKAEGHMDDPELVKYGKVFAGEAWHLIHKRRETDGWYQEPHE